jgi:hypothetical protein
MFAVDMQDSSSSRTFLISGEIFVRSRSNQDNRLVTESGLASDMGTSCVEETTTGS